MFDLVARGPVPEPFTAEGRLTAVGTPTDQDVIVYVLLDDHLLYARPTP